MNEFIIDELRRKQNERLLEVLEEEQKAEQVCAWMCRCVGLCMGAGPPLPPLHVYVHYVYVYTICGVLLCRPCFLAPVSIPLSHTHAHTNTHPTTHTHKHAHMQARATTLKKLQDDEAEMERLGRAFAMDRAKASQRIMRMTAQHEVILVQRMGLLGLA